MPDTKTNPSIGIILRHSPYSHTLAQEGLEAALAGGALGQTMTLFIVDDGVFYLLKNQKSHEIQRKSIEKLITIAPLYDIDKIIVCAESLRHRHLLLSDFCVDILILEPDAFSEHLRQQSHLLSF